jgi:hypothetical protein
MSLVAIVHVHELIVAAPLTRMIRVRSVISPQPCQCSLLGKPTIYSPRAALITGDNGSRRASGRR